MYSRARLTVFKIESKVALLRLARSRKGFFPVLFRWSNVGCGIEKSRISYQRSMYPVKGDMLEL